MDMDLEIRHLQLVAAVADVGSLTRAGDRLHLTQSALSHQLRDIESRLGAPLFLRVGKRLVLTPAGERLLASARDVLAQLQHAEQEIRQMGAERAGILRITTECYTCYHWLPPLLKRYRHRFPRVEVRIDVDSTQHPIEKLLAGKIDLGIVSKPVTDRRLASRPVFRDEVVLILSPDHRLARQPAPPPPGGGAGGARGARAPVHSVHPACSRVRCGAGRGKARGGGAARRDRATKRDKDPGVAPRPAVRAST